MQTFYTINSDGIIGNITSTERETWKECIRKTHVLYKIPFLIMLLLFMLQAEEYKNRIIKVIPNDCSFTSDTVVVLYTFPENAVIYYTMDGTVPDITNESHRYWGPITLNQTATLRAIAVKSDQSVSRVHEWDYLKEESKVTFHTEPGDLSFFCDTLMELFSFPDDAAIYFTTDGTQPDITNESQRYKKPFYIKKTATVSAIAIKENYAMSDLYKVKISKKL